jgi:hypothetical protein
MGKQKVSDQLKAQDQELARGLLVALVALRGRYPQSLELKCAVRDLDDFAKGLEPDEEPQG